MKKLLFLSFLSFSACTVSKDSRLLEKSTREWRESPVVLSAYLDTPLSGVFLNLRKNGKFEQTSSGILQSFDAGSWTKIQDTIFLTYMNSDFTPVNNNKLFIDRNTSSLIFDNDSISVAGRMRIMSTEL